jgi:glucan phosphoethanolaminetransferase (alkaline phosphatase superfamily)
MKRVASLLARCCFLAFFLLTSLYCLLAYVPFTYQQVVKGGVLSPLVAFARFHPWLYWLTIGALAATSTEDLRSHRVKRIFFALLGVFGIALLLHPLLQNLENTDASYYWSLLALAPALCLAVVDLSGADGAAGHTRAPLLDPHRTFTAAWQSALFLSLLYVGIACLRTREWTWTEGGVIFLSSVTHHSVLFATLFVILNWIWAAAIIFPQPQRAQFILLHLFGGALIWLTLHLIVFPPMTFGGARAGMYAAAVAVTASAFVAGIRLRTEHRASATGWVAGAWGIAAVALTGGWLALATARMDWNYLLQKLTATAVWLVVFLILCRTPVRFPIRPRSTLAMLLIAAGVVIAFRTLEATPLHQNHAALLDRYAGYDASFQLIRDTLAPSAPVGEETFYRFLSQNTNIPRSIPVAPVDVNLVERLETSHLPKPNIFIFVIDSLRRDYLSPYNPAVKFTPSIAAFARDSVVMENAFTRYGGTGLSEPSLWVGGMMLHQQYITPFRPMNSLEKLILANGYQAFVSRDTILATILGDWPNLSELDRSNATMYYDFSATLKELEGRISAAPSANGPIFAYTQPQNIHISVIQREKESVLSGGQYPGFYAPYASRLARVDSSFGEFIQFLKTRGIYDNSIIVFTSDHGDSLGEEGRWGHAYTIFPEILRIPLIVHLPSALHKRLTYDPDAASFLTDVTPSIYYLLGQKPIQPNEILGRPLFTEKAEEQKAYQRDDYLVASSYAAVYGILSSNGRRLYVADAANHRDYAFDLSGGLIRLPISDSMRATYQRQISDHILEINHFYRYAASSASAGLFQ